MSPSLKEKSDMKHQLGLHAKIAGIVFFALGATLSAQEPTFAIKVDVPLVSVDVSVKTGSKSVQGLTKDDFLLYEDGRLQEIQHFSSSVEPIKLFAIAPWSLPYGLPRGRDEISNRENEALELLAEKFHGTMKAAAGVPAQFNSPTYREIQLAVEKMRTVPGRKGIAVFIHQFGSGKNSSDSEPESAFQQMLEVVRESGIPIYVFYASWNLNRALLPGEQQRFTRIESAAALSGGGIVSCAGAEHACPTASQFIRGLAATNYTVAYSPANAADGKTHKIEIRLSEQRMSNLKNQKINIWQSRDQYLGK
jgi:hypothetical protein